ncbi:D-cysteine desulfhydrase family protein [Haloplasma contractile]|uniref:D-cysteine desulfhydrase protein n=1 Tax=Haloplasma contractile SSD-17B TaxID=1033810 RepID=U2DR00_9MOLU|nr:D-cysteine desulfhydrase family protein [Haloplasma contractile]ERJ11002.1 D-cysteine desulfhydrase protein [Haloplasma contractile SSD-17B]
MIKLPKRIHLANIPTRIERLDRLTKELGGPRLFIKRDDETGTEVSGNKVRKMEYIVRQALDQGCDYLITCGGIQSNHARSTAAIAAKLGMGSALILRNRGNNELDGNYFLNQLLGATIKLITPDEYKSRRMEIMRDTKLELEKEGHRPYIIPEGGSMGIGTFGYVNAMLEIQEQEKELGVHFDAIVLAVGSGGTYSGLFLANKLLKRDSTVYGINVCDDACYFKNQIANVLKDSFQYVDVELEFSKNEINILDGYVGEGYAVSRPEELRFIRYLAKLEGVILDPVYTGKAMYGLVNEIKSGNLNHHKNILFIHTGGLFGLFPKKMSIFDTKK